MNRLRKIAEIPAGSWTKWVVVGVWVVVLVIALPLSSKLTGAEKNDASAWLPGGAESTKVLNVQSQFQSPNVYPGVVVYERASGLTAADRAKAAADARAIAGVHGVLPGQVVGPVPSADGRAIQIIFQVDLGTQGWGNATKAVDSVRAITTSNANGLVSHITGPLGNAADSNNVFKGIDGTLLYSALAVVILILLITYRSPVLWLLPVISSGVALITAQAVIYLLAAHAGRRSTRRAPASWMCWSSARARITHCCSSRATGRSCAATTAVARRWSRRYGGPGRPSSPAAAPSSWRC